MELRTRWAARKGVKYVSVAAPGTERSRWLRLVLCAFTFELHYAQSFCFCLDTWFTYLSVYTHVCVV